MRSLFPNLLSYLFIFRKLDKFLISKEDIIEKLGGGLQLGNTKSMSKHPHRNINVDKEYAIKETNVCASNCLNYSLLHK